MSNEDAAFTHRFVLDADVLTDGIKNGYDVARIATKYYGSVEGMVRAVLLDHYYTADEMFSIKPADAEDPVKFGKQFRTQVLNSVYEQIENFHSEEEENGKFSEVIATDGDILMDGTEALVSNINERVPLYAVVKDFYAQSQNEFLYFDVNVYSKETHGDNPCLIIDYSLFGENTHEDTANT